MNALIAKILIELFRRVLLKYAPLVAKLIPENTWNTIEWGVAAELDNVAKVAMPAMLDAIVPPPTPPPTKPPQDN